MSDQPPARDNLPAIVEARALSAKQIGRLQSCMSVPVAPIAREVAQIASDGRLSGLSAVGAELQPVTAAALNAFGLPPEWASAVALACDAAFAASIEHEAGSAMVTVAEVRIRKGTSVDPAADAATAIRGRLRVGAAEAIVASLMFGSGARLLIVAATVSPVQFASLCAASPGLGLKDRVLAAVNLLALA